MTIDKNIADSTILKKNLQALKKVDSKITPYIEKTVISESFQVMKCKMEGFFLSYLGKKLNSQINSVQEAFKNKETHKNILQKSEGALLIGSELGYTALAVLKSQYKYPVIVVDFNLEILKLSLTYIDFSDFILSEKLLFFYIQNIEDTSSYFNSYNIGKYCILPHRASFKIFSTEYSIIKQKIEESRHIKKTNTNTLKYFEKLWLKNTLINFYFYHQYNNLDTLVPHAQKVPTIIVTAGPSLEKQIKLLKSIQNQVTIICVSTSLDYLVENDIIPDFVLAVDPQSKLIYHFLPLFQKLKNKDINKLPILIAEPTISHSIVRKYPGKKILIKTSLLRSFFETIQDNNWHLDSGASVATTAYSLALKLQGTSILFIGLDLSYDKPITHFRGALLENIWTFSLQNRYKTIENLNFDYAQPDNPCFYRGFNKAQVLTSGTFMTYIQWLENRFYHYGKSFKTYNCSEGGIGFTQIENKPLSSVLETLSLINQKHPNYNNLIENNPDYFLIKEKITDSYTRYYQALKTLSVTLKKALRITESLKKDILNFTPPSHNAYKKLEECDQLIQSFQYKDLLHLNMQSTIDEILHSSENFLPKNETNNKHLASIKTSSMLYEALLESCTLSKKYLKKSLHYLRP